jgi:hypothetical protein
MVAFIDCEEGAVAAAFLNKRYAMNTSHDDALGDKHFHSSFVLYIAIGLPLCAHYYRL